MPENEFEKQVQHKMEELKVRPGLPVWAAVSAQILQQKSRRKKRLLSFGFLFFLLAITLVLSDNQINYSFKKHPQFAGNTVTGMAGVTTFNDAGFKNKKQNRQNKTIVDAKHYFFIKKHSSPILVTAVQLTSGKSYTQKNSTGLAGKKSVDQPGWVTGQTKPGIINENSNGNENTQQTSSVPNNTQRQAKQPSLNIKGEVVKDNFSKDLKDTVKSKVNTTIATSAKKQKSRAYKWAFGFSFTAGATSASNRYLGISNNNAYYSTSPSNNSGITGSNGGYTPSVIEPGFGFAAGLSATRKLTSKSNIVIAINYKLFKTNIATGIRNSLNGVAFYGAGNTNTYHESFHFIEVPLAFQTNVASIKKHALYLEASISFSKLIQSNALQFDTAQGNYYFNNTLFNKITTGVSAGLYLNVSPNKKAPLLIGPQIYYSVTPIANTGLYAKKHYSFAGISFYKLLHKI